MNRNPPFLALVLSLVFWGPGHSLFAQTEWQILDDYRIYFDGSGAEGTFRGMTGTLLFSPEQLSGSKFSVKLDPATISTGNDTKDKHALGKAWFYVEQYPKITFVSQEISKTADGFKALGTLTMHGQSKEMAIPFTFEQSGNTATFKGSFSVNREDFGIDGPLMAFTVGDVFQVQVEVPVRKK